MTEAQDPIALTGALDCIGEILAAGPDDDAREGVADAFGHYDVLPPRIELLRDGRMARLISAIVYHRQDGTAWPVPAGSTLDGASIPRVLWGLVGGPLEGKYRDASIIHDRYCDRRQRRWQDRPGLTDYELQDGIAGLEETSAETGAQHCVNPPALAQRGPRLAVYWASAPGALEATLAPTEGLAGPDPVGLAVREVDWTVLLDLCATDDSGAIGHALIQLQPGQPHHSALHEALFPPDVLEGAADPTGRRTAPFFG